MKNIAERFTWAVDTLEVQSNEQILEIGCSTGILAGLIAEKLHDGKLTAIDKSSAQLTKAEKLNTGYTDKITFKHCDFYDLEETGQAYNKIVAFNVNIFAKNPDRSLNKIRTLLASAGQFYIFHQAPYEIDISSTNPIRDSLLSRSYNVEKTIIQIMKPYSASCVIATIQDI